MSITWTLNLLQNILDLIIYIECELVCVVDLECVGEVAVGTDYRDSER